MVLSKKERQYAIAAGAAAALFLIYQFVYTPYVDASALVDKKQGDANKQLKANTDLLDRQKALAKDWAAIKKDGLKDDAGAAETQALKSLLDSAQGARVSLSAVRPERTTTEDKFQILNWHVTGNGSMSSISRLLWAMETTTMPMRVSDLQIAPTRGEDNDDLTVQMNVSTLCEIPANGTVKPVAGVSGLGGLGTTRTTPTTTTVPTTGVSR